MKMRELLSKEDEPKFMLIKTHIEKLFRSGTPANPYFTLHGPSHASAVEKHLQSIYENSKISLDKKELYLLLAATWFHDIGMIFGERENHHLKCREYVEDLKKDKLFKDDDLELEYIGLICQGHREQINLNSETYNDDIFGEHKIRLGLLTGLLRLADELDLDFRRAPKSLREIFNEKLDDIGRLHWMKHYYVKGVEFTSEEDVYKKIFVNVIISIRIPDKNHEEILKKLIIPPLEKVINETRNRLQDNGIRVRIRCQSKIEDVEKLPENLKVIVDAIKRGIRNGKLKVPPYEVKKPLEEETVKKITEIYPHFEMGSLKYPVEFLIGHPEESYRYENVKCKLVDSNLKLPNDVERVKNKLISEYKEDCTTRFYDGSTVRLEDWGKTMEKGEMTLFFSRDKYFTSIITNFSLDKKVLVGENGKKFSIREKYVKNPVNFKGSILGNLVGFTLNLVTRDNKVILTRRGKRVALYPNLFNATVSGTMNPDVDIDDSGIPNPFYSAKRETEEEIGLKINIQDIVFHALIIEYEHCKPELIGEIKIDKTLKEVLPRIRRYPKDRYEYEEIICKDFTPSEIFLLLKKYDWIPQAAVCLIFCLIKKYGEKEVEKAFS